MFKVRFKIGSNSWQVVKFPSLSLALAFISATSKKAKTEGKCFRINLVKGLF